MRRPQPVIGFAFRQLHGDQRAAAILEFALIAPVVFALVFGIVDFGRYFLLANTITNAVREGARLAAISAIGTSADLAATTTLVTNTVRARIADPQAATATVTLSIVGTAPTQTVQVSVTNYPFARAVPFLVPTVVPTVRAEFRYEFQ
jgi:Flp pilus assembly protein TadG